MGSFNPPLHVFVEVVGLELVGICIDKLRNEDFYGIVGIHVGHLLGCMKFLLELGFEVFKSMNTCWVLGILLTSPLVFMFLNHLGVVFGDVFELFWGFWLNCWNKRTKSTNLGNFRVLHYGVGIPRSSVSPRQGVACSRRGATCPHRGVAEREAWISLRYAEV